MRKFIKSYIDQILIIIAVLFVGLIVWFFVDSTAVITTNFTQAIAPTPSVDGNLTYNLGQAKSLDLRGFSQ